MKAFFGDGSGRQGNGTSQASGGNDYRAGAVLQLGLIDEKGWDGGKVHHTQHG